MKVVSISLAVLGLTAAAQLAIFVPVEAGHEDHYASDGRPIEGVEIGDDALEGSLRSPMFSRFALAS